MSFFEGNGQCSISEFERFRSSRLNAQELKLNEVCTLMLVYNFERHRRQAVRFATRITAMAVAEEEHQVDINFLTLDEDFKPISTFEARLDTTGEWRAPGEYTEEERGNATIEGYFKGYDDGLGSSGLIEVTGLQTPSGSVLVAV